MKLTNREGLRASGWLGLLLIELCLMIMGLGSVAHSQAFSTTTVQGTVYLANGQPGTGTLVLSWPSFTTASGQMVTADSMTVAIAPDGFVSVNLAPNLGATPAGLYYTAVYYLSDGSVNTQYWVVPATTSATLGQVQAQLMPATQAVQAASKTYVDQAVASLAGGVLTISGTTMNGPLTLCCDPTTLLQAADKHYVDAAVAQAVPLAGGTATGPLTSVKLGALYQVDQFAGADFGAKLGICLSGLSASNGGTCDARNFTGTLSMGSNLTIGTANATVLLPCATISTANQVVVTAGTRNVSLRGCALRGASTASGSQGGTVFYYSGAGAMVQVGDPTYAADTLGFHLDNAVINITAATSASAQGFAAYRTQELDLESLYFLGNSNQTGMTLDGTGNYTGGTFYDNEFTGFQTAVNAIGHQITNPATTDWLNASTFVRLHIDCPTSGGSPISGTYGINLQQGDGNTFTGGDVEGCSTALHLGTNAQNNTITGLRNENSTNQVVADAGSSYNSWMTGGTMFTGQLTDNGTRNSFLDTFHRSFNGLNGDWYGSQKDATVTNHYRLGTGAGNERGLLNRYQSDYGYRWTMGLSDATAGEQFYQILDELNNVYRISVGQYNNGQSSTNNQTVINAAGTGAVVLNGSNNAGTGGVVIGSGGASETTVATISNAGNAQFNGTLQVSGASTFLNSTTVKNQADAEIDATLWAGLTASQKESFIYKDWNGNSQWYMEKDASNNWALNSATGGLDSFKAYQSSNSGDTYINTSNSTGVVRINYETGSGAQFKVYGGNSGTLYASFTGTTSIQFPGLAASSGHNCLQIDNSGYVTNTGSACGSGGGGGGSGTVNSGTSGQIAYYSATGTVLSGTSAVSVTSGGTGSSTASGALTNLGAAPAANPTFSGTITTPLATAGLVTVTSGGVLGSESIVAAAQLPAATSLAQGAVILPTGASGSTLGTAAMQPAAAFDAAGAASAVQALIPAASSTTPSMNGTAAVGTVSTWARADHVHPTDTSRVSTTTTVNGHGLSSNVIVSASDLTTGTLPHGQLPTLQSSDIPNNAANTTGNAATATNVAYSGLTGTVPTWNQNTTGTSSNVTGTVLVGNGGTGATTAAGAMANLGAAPAANPTFSGTITTPLATAGLVTVTSGGVLGSESLVAAAQLPAATSSVQGAVILPTGASGSTLGTAAMQPAAAFDAAGAASAVQALIPIASSTTPSMNGTATVGTVSTWALADHVHPIDTSRVSTTTTVNGHALSSNVIVSASDLTTGTLLVGNGGTGATTAAGAMANLGAAPAANPTFSGTITTPLATAGLVTVTSGGVLGSESIVAAAQLPAATSSAQGAVILPTGASGSTLGTAAMQPAAAFDAAGAASAVQALIPIASSTTPSMNGTAAVGTVSTWALADHVHPTDTSRVSTTTMVNGHALSSNVTVSASDLTTGTLPHAQLPTLQSSDIPNNAANTTGTSSNVTGTVLVGNGGTGATTATGAMANLLPGVTTSGTNGVAVAGNAQFNGTLQVGGASTFLGSTAVENQANAEIDVTLWAGLTATQKESFIYKDWNSNNQWYMVKDINNNWALNSATGGLDSFKAYQSSNSGDTYIDTSNSTGVVRINYETGSGTQFKVYGGNSGSLYASFTGTTTIQFPGLAASSGHNCLQVDNSGYVTNTGIACGTGSGSGTVNSGTNGQIAYYSATGTAISGTSTVSVTSGGTGSSTASGALTNLGAAPTANPTFSGTITTPLATAGLVTVTSGGVLGSESIVAAAQLPAATSSVQGAVVLPTGASGSTLGTAAMQPATAFDAAGAASAVLTGATFTGPVSVTSSLSMANNASIGPRYDVTNSAFGAKGDGSTDDTAAIQAAFNACYNGGVVPYGGVVEFPGRHTYVVSSTIKAYDSCQIEGVTGNSSVPNSPPRLAWNGAAAGTVSTITAFSISSNTVTFTAANSLTAGQYVDIEGLTAGNYLNRAVLQVLATGLSSTQFTATLPFGWSNVTTTAGSGTATTVNVLLAFDSNARYQQSINNMELLPATTAAAGSLQVDVYFGSRVDSGTHVQNTWAQGATMYGYYFASGGINVDFDKGWRCDSAGISCIYWRVAGSDSLGISNGTVDNSSSGSNSGGAVMLDDAACVTQTGIHLTSKNMKIVINNSLTPGLGAFTMYDCPSNSSLEAFWLDLENNWVSSGSTSTAGFNFPSFVMSPANDAALSLTIVNGGFPEGISPNTTTRWVGLPALLRNDMYNISSTIPLLSYAPSINSAGLNGAYNAPISLIGDVNLNQLWQYNTQSSAFLYVSSFAMMPNGTTLYAGQLIASPSYWVGSSGNRYAIKTIYQTGTTGTPNSGSTTCTGVSSGNVLTCTSATDLSAGQRITVGTDTNKTISYVDATAPNAVLVNLASSLGSTYSSPTALSFSAPVLGTEIQMPTKSSGAPTTQYWILGDMLQNSGAATNGVAAWVNVAAGTPGTWAGIPLGNSSGQITSSQIAPASLQGTDTKVLTAGAVSGTASPLCTDSNGGATTSGCTSVVMTNQANTYSAGLQDFSAATMKQPSSYTVGTNTITSPATAGTLALTSQLSAYATLSGATFTGALSTTHISAKNLPIDVSASPYNAVADNSTDNTAAFQSAINAASLTGQDVYVPPAAAGYCYKFTHLYFFYNALLNSGYASNGYSFRFYGGRTGWDNDGHNSGTTTSTTCLTSTDTTGPAFQFGGGPEFAGNTGAMSITNTSMSSGTATYSWTLTSGTKPSTGQIVVVRGTTNGSGQFNLQGGTIATVTGTTSGTFTVTGIQPAATYSSQLESGVAFSGVYNYLYQGDSIENLTLNVTNTTWAIAADLFTSHSGLHNMTVYQYGTGNGIMMEDVWSEVNLKEVRYYNQYGITYEGTHSAYPTGTVGIKLCNNISAGLVQLEKVESLGSDHGFELGSVNSITNCGGGVTSLKLTDSDGSTNNTGFWVGRGPSGGIDHSYAEADITNAVRLDSYLQGPFMVLDSTFYSPSTSGASIYVNQLANAGYLMQGIDIERNLIITLGTSGIQLADANGYSTGRIAYNRIQTAGTNSIVLPATATNWELFNNTAPNGILNQSYAGLYYNSNTLSVPLLYASNTFYLGTGNNNNLQTDGTNIYMNTSGNVYLGQSDNAWVNNGGYGTFNGGIGGNTYTWLPSTLTGHHGNGAGDVKVQLSDGAGTSGYIAVYDANGGLTNGGGAPGSAAYATAGTSGNDVLQLSSGLVPAGNLPAATTSALGGVIIGTGLGVSSGTVSLNSQYTKWSCEPGLGDGTNAITAATYHQTTCYNMSGVTWTITAINCYTDNSGSSTIAVSDGINNLLNASTLTCSTGPATGTVSSSHYTIAAGAPIVFTFVADGTSKQTTWVVSGTF